MHFPIHFSLFGHEGRLATISRTRLTRLMAADESCSYPPVAELLVIADRVF